MQANEFNELSGRIEGIGRALMLLIVEAEESTVIASGFSERLRAMSNSLMFDNHEMLAATQKTLDEMSDGIDRAHMNRQT